MCLIGQLNLISCMQNVAKCETCGRPIFKCVCQPEDKDNEWYDDGVNGDYETKCGTIAEECIGEDVDAFGRNYSDADPGL